MTNVRPPIAERRPVAATHHGEILTDDYAWLRDREDPATIAYLEAENAWAEANLAPTKPLQERLYQEMLGRIKETDLSVPYRRGDWWYYSRTEEGKQYPIHCRRRGTMETGAEEVLLDLNVLAEGKSFMALGDFAVSDDGMLLAYSLDETGFRQYGMAVKHLGTGADLGIARERVTSIAWGADGQTIYYGIEDEDRNDYKDLNVTGKLVVILDGTPEGYKPKQQGFRSPSSSFGKVGTAAKKGAAAVIVVAGNFPRRNTANTGQWTTRGYVAAVTPPVFTVSEKAATALMGADGESILTKMKSTTLPGKVYSANVNLSFAKTTTTGSAANILGFVEGTDKKDEWVILTAHYDHIGVRNGKINYGADDDGSGTVSILELAEAFAKAKAEGKGPRRSILFMTVSGEEHGLWGSAHYADNPVYPLEKTTVNLNIDMIGRIGNEYLTDKDSMNYVYIIGDDKLSSDLTPITDAVNKTYTKIKLDRKYNDPKDPNRFYYRSDHYNFAEKGVPIIFYFNGVHKDYHQPTDTPDKIAYTLMEKRAKLVFHTAWEMANREEMLKRDMPLNK